ncbi:hypothetical protein V6N13_035019 [Hibiscus sabdariffa]|uniref:Uncharacterized protein n=1 Tax=Hibiscus sabdariffa TaxID=183260 RepID=A0ABR2AFB6_9ROSI
MPPKPTKGSRIRPIASTYNVMITLVYPFFSLVVQRTVAPPTRKGINIETSLPFESENLWRKSGFKFPETTRLYSQREYAAPKIIPSAANVATKLFLWKAPTKMRNSPIKLLVPGRPKPFPSPRPSSSSPRPASGGRKRTRAGSARFAFSCVESFSFSYIIEARVHAGDGLKSFHGGGRAASSLSGRNKKGKLVVGGKTRLVECDSTEEPYSIGALARYN